MKAGDFFRNNARYLDRMDTFFDKAMGRNGKENRFATDIGIVEVAGFTTNTKNIATKKYVTSKVQVIASIKGNASKGNSAKMLFDMVNRQGLGAQNNIEFTYDFNDGKKVPRRG